MTLPEAVGPAYQSIPNDVDAAHSAVPKTFAVGPKTV
jgi:hypothetical protein